jgi:type II secretory pathway pseudopilin PulG
MTEALLTALGLILGVAATVVSLAHDEKASPTRRILLSLAIAGLCGGLFTTFLQFMDQQDAARKAREADNARQGAVQQLTDLQSRVGNLAQVDAQVQAKTADLTALNQLGGAQYYVVIDTFDGNSCPKLPVCADIVRKLTALYPNAQTSGMLWTSTVGDNKIQLRFGHHLTPSAAEIFRGLAGQGLAHGNPLIRRE